MNTLPNAWRRVPGGGPGPRRPAAPAFADEGLPQAACRHPLFTAAWTRFVFVHYAVPPGDLAPHTPLELDCRDGRALVSLVFFRMSGMAPAVGLTGPLGRLLCRPASDAGFLNVRTYVRGEAGPGIQFMVEWMDNPLGLCLGPWMYGLPYRRGRFVDLEHRGTGRRSLRVSDAATRDALDLSVIDDPPGRAAPGKGSLADFLLEKYTAYTCHGGVCRCFQVAHPRWQVSTPLELDIDDRLVCRRCPWFARAERIGAHCSPGFGEVRMGAPSLLQADGGGPRAGEAPSPCL